MQIEIEDAEPKKERKKGLQRQFHKSSYSVVVIVVELRSVITNTPR